MSKMKKNKVGRPMMFNTAKELEKAIDEYFKKVDVPSIAGISYHLGMSRECLRNYGTKQEFSDIIKRAKQRVEIYLETQLNSGAPATGSIFNLKCNFHWRENDEQKADNNVVIEVRRINNVKALPIK